MRKFDELNADIGGSRNIRKTEVVVYATRQQMENLGGAWKIEEIKALANITWPEDEESEVITLGLVCGTPAAQARQFEKRGNVIAKMAEKIQVVQDTQIELNLTRAALGVGKVTHMLRGHSYRETRSESSTRIRRATGRDPSVRGSPRLEITQASRYRDSGGDVRK